MPDVGAHAGAADGNVFEHALLLVDHGVFKRTGSLIITRGVRASSPAIWTAFLNDWKNGSHGALLD